MRPTRILAIAPYEGLRELLVSVAANRSDLEIDAYSGDLEDGASLALSLAPGGYDVILSRGGTALLIEKAIPLPVIDIAPSPYDLLRCIRLARSHREKFAVVGFSSITAAAGRLFGLMQRPLDVFTISEQKDAEECIAELKRDGYALIIGDAIAVATAGKQSLAGILITSGEESVREAFDQAVRLHRAMQLLDEQLTLLRLAVGKCDISVSAFSENGKLRYSNGTNDQKEHPKLFARLANDVPQVINRGELRYSRSFGESLWHIEGQKVQVGSKVYALFSVHRKQALGKTESGMLRYYHMMDANDETKNSMPDAVGSMRGVIDLAEAYGRTRQAVCVLAEKGTSFETVLRTLHANSALKNNTMLTIDFASFDGKAFSWLLEDENSPLFENNLCVCMVGANLLGEADQGRLVRYAQNTLLEKRSRVFHVFIGDRLDSLPVADHIGKNAYLMLKIPPLRERPQDVASLSGIYLGNINVESGRQVIGLDTEAEKRLAAFSWPGNNDQLYRTLKALALSAKEELITLDEVEEALREEHAFHAGPGNDAVSLEGTLEEISARVIRKVLAEENMNQARTARRLGIGRSTLWRALNRCKG